MAVSESLKRAQQKYRAKFRNINLRVTAEQFEKVNADARAAGLPLATYIRQKLGI